MDKKRLEETGVILALPTIMEKMFHYLEDSLNVPKEIRKIYIQAAKGLLNSIDLSSDNKIDFDKLKSKYVKKVLDKLFYDINDRVEMDNVSSRTIRDQLVETIPDLKKGVEGHWDLTIKIGNSMMEEFKSYKDKKD